MTTPNAVIDSLGKPIVLNPPTMKAWKRAVNAAAKDGVNLPNSVTSSYRSPEQQAALVAAAQAGDPNAITPAALTTHHMDKVGQLIYSLVVRQANG